jgi:hypothetical protein
MLVENLWVGYKQLKVDCQELPLVPEKYSRYHPEEIEHQVQCNDFEIVERIEVALGPEYCKFLLEIPHVDGGNCRIPRLQNVRSDRVRLINHLNKQKIVILFQFFIS